MISPFRNLAFIALVFAFTASCASVKEIIQEPEVSVVEVRVSELSYFEITLEMELLVSNPNPVGIELEGLDYNLFLSESSFVKGIQDEKITVVARGTSSVVVPVTMNFQNIYQTFSTLADAGEAEYNIVAGLHFTLPGLGEKRMELSHKGQIPLIHLPHFEFESLYVSSLGLMGADIIIILKALNPNSFNVNLNEFQGILKINKLKWAELRVPEIVEFPSEEWTDMGFQIRLEFLSMGRTVRDLLSGEEALFYDYQGNISLESSLELLKEASLPLHIAGEVELIKPDSTIEGRHSSQKIEDSIEDNLLNLFGAYSR